MDPNTSYTQERLHQEHDENIALIDRIKREVAQEYDNLNNPLPLFSQIREATH